MPTPWSSGRLRGARAPLALALLLAASPLPAAGPCEAFRFAPARDVVPIGASGKARVADLNGDRRADLLALDGRGIYAYGAVQRPDGTFAKLTTLDTDAFDVFTADVDGDGVAEGILVGRDGPRVYRVIDGNRPEIGPLPTSMGTVESTWPRAVSDLDGDGRAELLVNEGNALVAFRLGPGGAFAGQVVASLSLGAATGLSLVVGDFDGDGDEDVVATAENAPTNSPKGPVLWGNGSGGFLPGDPAWFPAIQTVAVADFDRNGKQDFVYAGIQKKPAGLQWGASFVTRDAALGLSERALDIVTSPASFAAADFDRDGYPDLADSRGGNGSVVLYRGDGFEFVPALTLSELVPTAAADLDGDGYTDLVGTTETAVRFVRNICHTSLPDASVPVVVSLSGAGGVRFETEMTVDSRTSTARDLEVRYVPSFGGGAGTATFRLEGNGQLFFPSVLDALAGAGVPLPPDGDRGGTLGIRVVGGGPSDLAVTTRVVAQRAARSGVSFAERPLGSGTGPSAVVGWLRETGGDRSNLAVVNLGGEKEGDVVLRVSLASAEGGGPTVVLPEVRLAPGGLHQWNRVLSLGGLSAGWALVERVSGTAPFFAYGVVNDEGTGDGSFVPAFENGGGPLGSWVVPAVVETGRYTSALVVTNTTADARSFSFRLVAEAVATPDQTVRFQLQVPAFGQLFVPELVEELRRLGVAGVPPRGTGFGGALFVDLDGNPAEGLFVGARTSAGKPEGRYGVFYEAVPLNAPERYLAVVPAVRQDASVRTNVAIVNLADTPIVFEVFARDPARNGRATGEVRRVTVEPRKWTQVDSVLSTFGTGLSRARVDVVPTTGPARFVAYGVTNEGAIPGAGSDDGTYVPGR
jgi:hypothetical protein